MRSDGAVVLRKGKKGTFMDSTIGTFVSKGEGEKFREVQ